MNTQKSYHLGITIEHKLFLFVNVITNNLSWYIIWFMRGYKIRRALIDDGSNWDISTSY